MDKDKKDALKKYLMEKAVSRISVIIILIGFFYYVAMETDTFNDIPEIIKVAFYVGINSVVLLLGGSMMNFKEFAEKLRDIAQDPQMDAGSKLRAYEHIAVQAITQANELWDMYKGVVPTKAKEVTKEKDGS